MSFSVKQLLYAVLFVGIGLAALANADIKGVTELANLGTVVVLILMGYGVWISAGEARAFRTGFLCWVAIFWWANKWPYNIGADLLINHANDMLHPKSPVGDWIVSYFTIGRCLLSLLAGLIGGWVTVYFYRKRQQMLGGHEIHRSG